MNPKLLEPNELEVECELRNIKGLLSVKQLMLSEYFENEENGIEAKPVDPHTGAFKNPRRELGICAKKICEIEEALLEDLKSDLVLSHLY